MNRGYEQLLITRKPVMNLIVTGREFMLGKESKSVFL